MASPPAADRWRRLETLFHEALGLPAEKRRAFLDSNCTDHELRAEVEALLKSSDEPHDFLQNPVRAAAHSVVTKGKTGVIAPGTRLSHYEVICLIGSGGMGEVYLAQDLHLGRKVAVKTLSKDLTHDERGLRRFEHEARAASALNHPNILTIYEFGHVNGLYFIVSEYIEGLTLRDKLTQTRLEIPLAVEIARQIASAIAAAHASGIVHRDIKPENVIVREDGLVKVLDFGIAKLGEALEAESLRDASPAMSTSTTQPGMVLGTARYMSPEQARGILVDGRSDIFSIGAVMYEMLASRAPFSGETRSDVIAEILKTDPPPLLQVVPDIPADLERIINKALRKDREDRYQSVKDLMIDLQDFNKELEFQAKLRRTPKASPTPRSPDTTGAQRAVPMTTTEAQAAAEQAAIARWRIALIALLLVVVGVIGYVNWKKTPKPAPVATQPRSLAILPFRNLQPDPKTDFLGFSLADAVISKLGYVNALTIRPSSSVEKYRNTEIDPQKVAGDLDVDTLLTGTYIKEGDDLRITTQLIDAKADKLIWRDTLDFKYDKLLTVQDQVSQRIIKGLELNLTPAEAANLKPDTPIDSLAYEYYLRGVDLYGTDDFNAAIKMLEKSASIAPNYALTWAHLGRAYTTNASLQFGGRLQYQKAQAAYEKALALNPALIEARIYMGNLLTDTGRPEQAVPLLRGALQSSPNNAEAHWELGYAYRFGGMLDESVAECERARQYNPQVKINSSALNAYLYLGQYDKFMQSLPANDSVYVLFYRGFGEYYLQHPDEAARLFDRAYEVDSSLLPADVGKALSDAIKNQQNAGLALLRQIETKIDENGVSDAEGIYKIAQAYAVLGDKPSALRMLRKTIEGGFFCYPYFVNDPLLQNLRGDSDFQTLLSLAQQRHEQFKKLFF